MCHTVLLKPLNRSEVGVRLGVTMTAFFVEVFEALKGVLFLDSAVAGEAAALAVGLLLLGSSRASAVDELLAYAQDTQHEKIRRACGVAIALLMFKKEEEVCLSKSKRSSRPRKDPTRRGSSVCMSILDQTEVSLVWLWCMFEFVMR